jgi:FkbM family methyltransferase
MGWRRTIYHTFDRRGGRSAFAVAISAYATIRFMRPCRVFYDHAWIQEGLDGVFVEPKPSLRPLSKIREQVFDSWMYQYLPQTGDTVVDVGAGAGDDTIFFSRLVGPTGRVISIEAHPRTFYCLQETCRRNRLNNVSAMNYVVTSSACEVFLTDAEEYLTNRISHQDRGLPVEGRTLDEIIDSLSLPRIDLLKMNIEGGEKRAIVGMSRAIRRTRYACIACHDFLVTSDGQNREEVCTERRITDFLRQNGFRTSVRESDPRPHVRHVVYGSNTEPNCGAMKFPP